MFCESGLYSDVLQSKWKLEGLVQSFDCFNLNFQTVASETNI
jgi:hypothetical protein